MNYDQKRSDSDRIRTIPLHEQNRRPTNQHRAESQRMANQRMAGERHASRQSQAQRMASRRYAANHDRVNRERENLYREDRFATQRIHYEYRTEPISRLEHDKTLRTGKTDRTGKIDRYSKNNGKKKGKGKIVVIIVLAVLLALGIAGFVFAKNKMSKINYTELEEVETYDESEGYTTIALFGLDARDGMLSEGVNSDTIMIASIDNATHDVRIASIFRDTLLETARGEYDKANSAYCEGGPTKAINMLNRCFDLSIEKFVSVDFNAIVDVVDCLGGLDIEMTAEEAFWTNGYAGETAAVVGQPLPEIFEEVAGLKHCNGVQAVSFCRIRYTDGDDFKRTERQRLVLEKIFEKAKHADISQLNNIIDQVFPKVYTNFTPGELLETAADAASYNLVEKSGFPQNMEAWEGKFGNDYMVARDFRQEVIDLHHMLYPNEEYQPSQIVNDISNEMAYMLSIDYTQ